MTLQRYVHTETIRLAVTGCEPAVLEALEIAWPGRGHIRCPYPGHDDRHPSWRWNFRTGRALCTCQTNGHADTIFDVVMKVRGINFEAAKLFVAEAVGRHDLIAGQGNGANPSPAGRPSSATSTQERPRTKTRPDPRSSSSGRIAAKAAYDRSCWTAADRAWREAVGPRGTLAEAYLRDHRGGLVLDDDVAGRALRFHPACPFENGRLPCLVALFRDIYSDEPRGIHRLGLRDDGTLIGKLTLGPRGGAAIKLDADEWVTTALAIVEGVEDGMTLRQRYGMRPVWVLGCAGAIRAFPVLGGVEVLTIAADHDANGTGQNAAETCRKRWRAAGREVTVILSQTPGRDYNDRLRGASA